MSVRVISRTRLRDDLIVLSKVDHKNFLPKNNFRRNSIVKIHVTILLVTNIGQTTWLTLLDIYYL